VIENAILEALEADRHVFVGGAVGQTKERLEKLGLVDRLSPDRLLMDRPEALRQAVAIATQHDEPISQDSTKDSLSGSDALSLEGTTV